MTSIRFRHVALGALCILAGCAPAADVVTTGSGLRYEVVARGRGEPARAGQSVRIHETTTLANGTVLFTSRANDTPIPFTLGANHVIAGVEEGVTGMRVGERRRLVVPPHLSRRSSYPPNTPPDSTLYIDVELVSVADPR